MVLSNLGSADTGLGCFGDYFLKLLNRVGWLLPTEHLMAILAHRTQIVNRMDILRYAFQRSKWCQVVDVDVPLPTAP
jgi:hypothetical protein